MKGKVLKIEKIRGIYITINKSVINVKTRVTENNKDYLKPINEVS